MKCFKNTCLLEYRSKIMHEVALFFKFSHWKHTLYTIANIIIKLLVMLPNLLVTTVILLLVTMSDILVINIILLPGLQEVNGTIY